VNYGTLLQILAGLYGRAAKFPGMPGAPSHGQNRQPPERRGLYPDSDAVAANARLRLQRNIAPFAMLIS
jgi:hypothetical protein